MLLNSTISPLTSPASPLSLFSNKASPRTAALLHTSVIPTIPSRTMRGSRVPQTLIMFSSSGNQTTVVVPSQDVEETMESAADVVRSFYRGVNDHDLASVENLIAEKCVYEDLIFPAPFVGRKAILEFFKKFDSISTELKFVIDDISSQDSSAVGVTWHLEWKGRSFPFSKGCSFYRLEVIDGKRQIIYGRDAVEPAIKPGEAALVAIRGVTWLLQQFPQLADRL
ncbi:hypothetical protein SLE2022_334000 [Rubroshorea leprosula]|uniref:SnoaL-like domain-containing protein n=1 Tax=Rubroshorea leprosula TaxID=152421 RepID=A0AAV5IKJ5_9ROSI|nr:hypothetical protein SLEP1_g12443 [Rubroshorea leprosula]